MSMYQRIVVYITAPKEKALDIARLLVDEKLAACVNVVDSVKSVYWWEGKVEEDEESLLIVKTELGVFGRLVKRVKEIHPYEVPEIIALPIIGGNPDYLSWITSSLGLRGDESGEQ
jgi:periplasmic divalent cation tolerance protein